SQIEAEHLPKVHVQTPSRLENRQQEIKRQACQPPENQTQTKTVIEKGQALRPKERNREDWRKGDHRKVVRDRQPINESQTRQPRVAPINSKLEQAPNSISKD